MRVPGGEVVRGRGGTHRWLGRSWWVGVSLGGCALDGWMAVTHSCVHSLLTSRSVIELFPVAASISLGVLHECDGFSCARAKRTAPSITAHRDRYPVIGIHVLLLFQKNDRNEKENKEKERKIVSRRRDERVWCWSVGRSIARVCRRSPSRRPGRNNSTGSTQRPITSPGTKSASPRHPARLLHSTKV